MMLNDFANQFKQGRELDQKHRLAFQELIGRQNKLETEDFKLKRSVIVERIHKADIVNERIMDSFLTTFGIEALLDLDGDALEAAFLIMQHNMKYINRESVSLFKRASEDGKIKRRAFCLIKDRYLLSIGLPQLYGTQVLIEGTNKGILRYRGSISDVEIRRAKLGLGSLEKELELLGISYHKILMAEKAGD